MIESDERCRALCIISGNRCSRRWKWKGYLCKQHYRLYGKKNGIGSSNNIQIINVQNSI